MRSNREIAKVVLLGDGGVGKTSLRHQFLHRKFASSYKATIGADFITKDVSLPGEDRTVTMQIWDTAGTLGPLTPKTNSNASFSFSFVYDVTSPASLENLKNWLTDFIHQADIPDPESFPIVIIGNKVDSEVDRRVTRKQGLDMARYLKGLCLKMGRARARENFMAEHSLSASSPRPVSLYSGERKAQSALPLRDPSAGLGIHRKGKRARIFGLSNDIDADSPPIQTVNPQQKQSVSLSGVMPSSSPDPSRLATNLTFKSGFGFQKNEIGDGGPPASLFEIASMASQLDQELYSNPFASAEATDEERKPSINITRIDTLDIPPHSPSSLSSPAQESPSINNSPRDSFIIRERLPSSLSRNSIQRFSRLTRRSSLISQYTTASEFSAEGLDSERGGSGADSDDDDGIWTAGDRELEIVAGLLEKDKDRLSSDSRSTLRGGDIRQQSDAEETLGQVRSNPVSLSEGASHGSPPLQSNSQPSQSLVNASSSSSTLVSTTISDVPSSELNKPDETEPGSVKEVRRRIMSFSPYEDHDESFPLFEASAKMGISVDDAFEFIARMIRPPRYDFEVIPADVIVVDDDWGSTRRPGRSCAC
ncbi:hypothetical protein HDU67_003175 [Dinochytrium kinnereticum]|nr:hypothetical protein HDU67_003175 [Dinochytrium kinnereticum]